MSFVTLIKQNKQNRKHLLGSRLYNTHQQLQLQLQLQPHPHTCAHNGLI